MPHVIVKLWPGRSEENKQLLADKITKLIVETVDVKERSVSVAIEEVEKEAWNKEVYEVDIIGNEEKLYKAPGY